MYAQSVARKQVVCYARKTAMKWERKQARKVV